MSKTAAVYILASDRNGTLYTGVTSDLARRIHAYRQHLLQGFTSKYEVTRLVWYLQGDDIAAAIALEKKIKNRARRWKLALIEKANPRWDDLAAEWWGPGSCDFAQDDGAASQDGGAASQDGSAASHDDGNGAAG